MLTHFTLLLAAAMPHQETLQGAPDGRQTLDGSAAAPISEPATAPAISPAALAAITDRLLLDEPGDGRVWARGRQFKASFGADGFSYIPFLGSDAPRNFPVTFTVASATVAGEALSRRPLDGAALVGETVTLDHGSFQEVYHLTNTEVEQTFMFNTLPRSGELRLRMDVSTELKAESRSGGFAFVHPLGEVHYGTATAIDADGKSAVLEQYWTGSGIEVVVPADFVAMATLPLVIDPVISTFGVVQNPRRQIDIDTAFDSQNNTYQIVFSQVESVTDHDVLTVFYNASLALLVMPSSIDISSAYWEGPRTASCYEEETFLCVANVGFGIGSRRIRGRTRHAGTGARSAQFHVSAPGADFCDVGGNGNDVITSWDYMVVWQHADIINQDFNILGQAVSAAGSTAGSVRNISTGVGDQDRFPSISKSSGRTDVLTGNHEYMVVWERELSPTNHDIWARVVERSGSTTGHSSFRAYRFSDARDPDVSVHAEISASGATERYWVIAFERLRGADFDIFAAVAYDGSAFNARSIPGMQNLEDEQRDQLDPSIAFDSQDYLLAYHSRTAAGGLNAHFCAFNVVPQGGELRVCLAERRADLRVLDGQSRQVAIASHYDGGGPFGGGIPGDGLAVWVAGDPGASDVGGAVVAEPSTYSVGTQFCDANDNSSGLSAWMNIQLDPNFYGIATPGDTARLHCFNLPLNAFGFFIASNQSGFTANPGGSAGNICLAGSVGRFSNSVRNSGATGTVHLSVPLTQIAQPFGSTAGMSGETWHFQYWTRDFQNGVVTSNFSNAASLYIN